MMGDNINQVNWPSCGEIDVMENVGKEPSINHGSMHMPASGSTSDSQLTGMYTLPGGAKLGDDFHIYAIEWSSSQLAFYVDDVRYETVGTPWLWYERRLLDDASLLAIIARPTTEIFVLQAGAIFLERSALGRRLGLGRGIRGWTFAMFALVGPVFLLFHPPFVRGVCRAGLRSRVGVR